MEAPTGFRVEKTFYTSGGAGLLSWVGGDRPVANFTVLAQASNSKLTISGSNLTGLASIAPPQALSSIPEPSAIILLSTGLALFGICGAVRLRNSRARTLRQVA